MLPETDRREDREQGSARVAASRIPMAPADGATADVALETSVAVGVGEDVSDAQGSAAACCLEAARRMTNGPP